jgi:SNF2 family DNA or RNA helicase
MRVLSNSGHDRVIDEIRSSLTDGCTLDIATSDFSLFAFTELQDLLSKPSQCRIILPQDQFIKKLLGGPADRTFRNRLTARAIAYELQDWLSSKAEIRCVSGSMPQSAVIISSPDLTLNKVIVGSCSFSTEGFGITPGNQFSLIQTSENPDDCARLKSWFDAQWNSLPVLANIKENILDQLSTITEPKDCSLIYHLMLFHLFKDIDGGLDEDTVIKSATGIRNMSVWKKLFKFQKDGVLGAIDKLERLGGCIIADSVGLGKTFEALAIIKYYELRNDRVLVLCPKRLRDNWTIYKSNEKRNILASDRFNYDVLNHTDLSRDDGMAGDINLAHINWGNYDLIVIDESHNFRNKPTRKGSETRYDLLMRRIIKEGVKTKVLMLSATPVNNRLADLKNQIAFVTEGEDLALTQHGIQSIEATVRQAQMQFNRWLNLPDDEKKPMRLMEMLGFDYFKLLDLLTIARSRKHIEKYYGTDEMGKFPARLKPINIKPDVDLLGDFKPIRDINDEIRRMNLSSYAPLRYVLPHRQDAYDKKYSTSIRGGQGFFRQIDREESLVHLLRVNMLKRMESSVSSFTLTLERQIGDVKATLARIDRHEEDIEEISLDIEQIDIEDPIFESLLVGRKVKVLLKDVDLVRWRQDLREDIRRLNALYESASQVNATRDAKLEALRHLISQKVNSPINPGNRKIIIFTAFADTAEYLYKELSVWARANHAIHSALVTGKGINQTTVDGIRRDLGTILSAFSPKSKERPQDLASEGEIDLLIATDCISEGQNLQDCDYLINYDIHWNPVRIIQRFGRIDRIGSVNEKIQLVNFWPNIEIDEYIKLEQRVSGRMVLLDISATGEENLIEQKSGDQMNDLEYRRKQLLKLQDAVIDMEDLSTGLSIADLTLNDFRIDLATYRKHHVNKLEDIPQGVFSVTRSQLEQSIQPGVIFCLRSASEDKLGSVSSQYPLAPHYVVHIGIDGLVVLPFTQVKQILDNVKRLGATDSSDMSAIATFNRNTQYGKNMKIVQSLLADTISSIIGKKEERAITSLFTPGGTHGIGGEFSGMKDFEVLCYLVILAEDQ